MIQYIWPNSDPLRMLDRLAIKARRFPGYCVVCGRITRFSITSDNIRESVVCGRCWSFNRQRQLVLVLFSCVAGMKDSFWSGINDLPKDITLWNVEANGAVHKMLSERLGGNYISSEFLDPSMSSGELRGGVMHVDMQKTHFGDCYLDFILSSDVVEHMPHPELALRETYRILKPGGYHVFTVPFYGHRFTNEKRAYEDEQGVTTEIMPPLYHGDPVRADKGILVYNIFAPEILSDLEKMGFEVRWCRVHSLVHGVIGNNGIVLAARKPLGVGA